MTMNTAFAGDWHGNLPWATQMLRVLHDNHPDVQVIYHAGDFGLWPGPGGKKYLFRLNRTLTDYDQTMYVVLGNHEDYDRVAVMRTDDDGWLYLKDYPRLRFAPRGHIWVDRGVRMAAVGGATSIDRKLRTPGKSWWAQEEITDADVSALAGNLSDAEWNRVDVMITHDAPAGLRRTGLGSKPSWLTPEIEHDAWQGRVRLREAVDTAAPRWLVHGHWHWLFRDALDGVRVNGDDYTCEVLGLPHDGSTANVVVAELIPGFGLELVKAYPPHMGFLP